MKKILAFVVLFSFLIIPQLSLAKNIIADSDLGAIFAQGSVTIIYDDINITSKTLKTTSTDGLDFWGDDHASFFGPAHPDYERTDSGAYVGYADV
ncbi:MAG: hypothetical protein NTW65_02525, partial [Deltaproteobacteria bacterium]|nr:hypothetical protein [Deltaproteobacteria bacterium]